VKRQGATITASQNPPGARGRLLSAAMDHVAEHGVGDLSLRGLAAASAPATAC